MRYLTLLEVLELHHQIIEQSGGAVGIRDLGVCWNQQVVTDLKPHAILSQNDYAIA